MEKFTAWLEKTLLPIAAWMRKEKHLKAITNSLMSCMVILLIGSIACVLASPPIDYTTLGAANPMRYVFMVWSWASVLTEDIDWWVYDLTISMLSLWAAFGIGYYFCKEEGTDPLVGAFVSLLSVLVINCGYDEAGGIDLTYLSAQGLFAAMVVGVLSAEFYCFLSKKKVGYIKMPDGVPPAISNQFASLTPMFVVAIVAMALNSLFVAIGTPLPALILSIFQPLVSGADSLFGIGIAGLLEQVLWWFGIHNTAIGAILDPIETANLAANAAAYASGASTFQLPYVFTDAFWYFQGFGYYLPLVVMLCLSKSEQCKAVGKVAIVPAIFNVGEPVLFGMPIVMNPMMLFPWIVTRLVHLLTFGGLMKAGILARTMLYPTWTCPAILGVYLSTFQGLQIVVMLVCLAIDTVIWLPFFKAYEKQCLEEEAAEA